MRKILNKLISAVTAALYRLADAIDDNGYAQERPGRADRLFRAGDAVHRLADALASMCGHRGGEKC